MRRFTHEQRLELGQLIRRAADLLLNAPPDLYEQLREVICESAAPTVAGLADRITAAECMAAAYRPPRETPFRTNVRLLHAKGLTPTQIADEIGTSANSVRVTLYRMRQLEKAA